MGYLCPVCSAPQADAEHLANHLAFTAMLRNDEHETYLDERVPDWSEQSPETLAPEVVEGAEETETEIESGHDHEHGTFEENLARGGGYGREGGRGRGGAGVPNDPEAQEILAEAEELTRRMREDADENGEEDA